MTRREQIIIGLAALAGAYGLFEYAIKPLLFDNGAPAPPPVNIQELVTLAGQAAPDRQVEDSVAFVLANHTSPWPASAFFDHPFDPAETGERSSSNVTVALPVEKYTYTGYMQMNDEAIAIINGIDYRLGDMLEGYQLEEILPEKVVLSRDGGSFSIQAAEAE